MPKYFLSCILLLNSISFVNAQSWAPLGGTWTYSLPTINPKGNYFQVVAEKDTIIQGAVCKKLIKRDSFGGYIDSEFMYELNDSVFYFQNGSFNLLYDFSVNVGDTVVYNLRTYTHQSNDTVLNVRGVVLNKNQVIDENSNTLSKLSVYLIPVSGFETMYQWPDSFIYVQNVGYLSGNRYLIYEIPMVGIPEQPALRCYSDSSISYVTDFWRTIGNGRKCDFIETGINNFPNEKKSIVYPNPSSGIIKIKKNAFDAESTIEILDLNGRVLLIPQLSKTEFDISSLENGKYILRLRSEKGVVYRSFIKN
ncbi:MAG: T9SS type A sorting domain-containing protein [Salibacteraceae bacterium]